jgi:adenylate cyclase
MTATRRLAAILAADVAGYSRLMGEDEEGTLERLKALRREILDPKIAEHRGRIVKTTGDGMLVEFASVVDAVRCAVEVQQAVVERNTSIAADSRIELRIGINLGDVIVEGDDLYGDGVNIAARVEALADAGGVFVSNTVYDQVRDRLPLVFEDLGEQQLKNIARSVRVYRVGDLDTVGTLSAPVSSAVPLPDKPSLAVLPFSNMSSDLEQEFFSDGIAEDVITALSRYPELFVIARNSCFTYRGRAVDMKQVGRELGVRYVLEGSVRKAGNRVRVTSQLIEAEAGNHVWANRYDRDLADIFALQDEITEAVATAVAPAIADSERQRAMRKPPGGLDAWSAYQRGLWHFSKGTPDDNALAEGFFQQAIDLDPSFAGGYTGLAFAQTRATGVYGKRSLAESENSTLALARRAVTLDGNDAEARTCFAEQLMRRGDYEGALAELELALAISPNLANAYGVLGGVLIMAGHPKKGRAALEKSIRLDPRNPNLTVHLLNVAISFYMLREYNAAVEAAKRGIRSYPDYSNMYRWLAAALGQTGRIDEAKEALAKAIAMAPTAFDMFVRRRVPWHRPEDHAHMLEGLRKTGWEDQATSVPEAQ